MAQVDQLIPARVAGQPPAPTLFEAIVIDTAAAITDDVRVRLVADDPRSFDGPLPWMPRDGVFPMTGDRALVGYSDQGEGWIVAWWPA